MLGIDEHGPEIVAAWERRSAEVVAVLGALGEDELRADSELPGWDRLTIACHLRYGAVTLRRMTRDALAGTTTAYYPEGRAQQRPSTLRPAPGESPDQAVDSMVGARRELLTEWTSVAPSAWRTPVVEPPDNRDLGDVTLGVLAMAGLTEFEVHGSDLALGLQDWSETFVRRILPARLEWLNHRRANHRDYDHHVSRTWLLVADDGPAHRVSVDGDLVVSTPAQPTDPADMTIEGSSRDLLALLLGRGFCGSLTVSEPEALDDFRRAFPGP